MSVVYRLTDRRRLKIDDIEVVIAPLDYKVKADMQALIIQGRPMDAAILALKHGIKDVDGLTLSDGSKYELEKDDSGALSEQAINDLLNIPQSEKINLVSISLLHGMPQKQFTDPETGKSLAGVKFVEKPASKKK